MSNLPGVPPVSSAGGAVLLFLGFLLLRLFRFARGGFRFEISPFFRRGDLHAGRREIGGFVRLVFVRDVDFLARALLGIPGETPLEFPSGELRRPIHRVRRPFAFLVRLKLQSDERLAARVGDGSPAAAVLEGAHDAGKEKHKVEGRGTP